MSEKGLIVLMSSSINKLLKLEEEGREIASDREEKGI